MEEAAGHIIVGELSLDGTVSSVPGVILMAGDIAREQQGTSFIVPIGNLTEASRAPGIQPVAATSLRRRGASPYPALQNIGAAFNKTPDNFGFERRGKLSKERADR